MKQAKAILRFRRLSENAVLPTRGSVGSIGYDLYSAYDYTIKKGGKEMVKTDLQMGLPEGHYGRVAPRSGLAWKNFIDVGAGVIDPDYRGPVNVILFNFGEEEFTIRRGDRVAQLIVEKAITPKVIEVDTPLEVTDRGEGGFGSTGV